MFKLFKWVLPMFLLSFGALASAQSVKDEPLVDPEPLIEAVSTTPSDDKIKTRIENIFAELDTLARVEVDVSEGVVTLSGETANDAQAQSAMRLAIRLEGVVTVEDEINRTLDVRENVVPLIDNAKSDITNLIKALPLIGLAFFAFIAFWFFGGFIARRKSLWKKIAPNPFLAELASQAARVLVIVLGAIVALNLLGASALITTLLGGAGVVGLAIGFAVRDSMENYISSIMLSLRQPFRARDHVRINEHEGIVVRLTSRATILMTLEGNHLRIPNSTVFKGIILNYTTNPERRFDFKLGVDAADDPVAAMQTGLDAVKTHDFVLEDPEPSALITDVGDSSIVIKFSGWVDQSKTNFGKARSLAIRSAMRVLEDNGFTLPEPIYRVRFDEAINTVLETGIGKPGAKKSKPAKKPKPRISDADMAESLDVAPDHHLQEKINEERLNEQDSDLLDQSRPTE